MVWSQSQQCGPQANQHILETLVLYHIFTHLKDFLKNLITLLYLWDIICDISQLSLIFVGTPDRIYIRPRLEGKRRDKLVSNLHFYPIRIVDRCSVNSTIDDVSRQMHCIICVRSIRGVRVKLVIIWIRGQPAIVKAGFNRICWGLKHSGVL